MKYRGTRRKLNISLTSLKRHPGLYAILYSACWTLRISISWPQVTTVLKSVFGTSVLTNWKPTRWESKKPSKRSKKRRKWMTRNKSINIRF
jgi:hypothetical protein